MKPDRKVSAALPEVRFENPRLTALGIEPMTMSELRRKASPKALNQPQRVDFFLLLLVMEGVGKHTVDFADWPLTPGSLLFVHPGQVQQWHSEDDFDAQLVLIDPSTLPHRNGLVFPRELDLLEFDGWPTKIQLDEANRSVIETGFRQLRQDFDLFSGEGLDISLMRHELMTLLLRIEKIQKQRQESPTLPANSQLTYRLFVQALEESFSKEHSLQYYARHLGYSESTISRACIASEGRSGKQVISRRLTLEAKRLLAHSSASVAEVAHQLGFSEATNFVKFFRRHSEVTPTIFRRKMFQKLDK